jgi:hypothetical protein
MPYGEGYTDEQLAELQAAYAATDDDATYEVDHGQGHEADGHRDQLCPGRGQPRRPVPQGHRSPVDRRSRTARHE